MVNTPFTEKSACSSSSSSSRWCTGGLVAGSTEGINESLEKKLLQGRVVDKQNALFKMRWGQDS